MKSLISKRLVSGRHSFDDSIVFDTSKVCHEDAMLTTLNNIAVFHYKDHSLHDANIDKWISVYGNDVSKLPGL